MKNRKREKYSFANINLLGLCNFNCFFCLGKDLKADGIYQQNQTKIHFDLWRDFKTFLELCKKYKIKKIFLTGQTADPLQYLYLSDLVYTLQEEHGFIVGLRSNGLLAQKKMDIIKRMNGEIGYTINSIYEQEHIDITLRGIPDYKKIIRQSGDNVRISVVVNRCNYFSIMDIIKDYASIDNIQYFQLRKISTETRKEALEKDRILFELLAKSIELTSKKIDCFSKAPIYKLYGKPVSLWRTVETSTNSINYFTDGTISENYFIVEGYQNECNGRAQLIKHGTKKSSELNK